MFSSRLRQGPGRNRLALALDRRAAAGLPITDLTESNPTRTGFDYPHALLAPLSQQAALCYVPRPFGLPSARRAVSADFLRRGVPVPADRIVLTASTSEAYSLLLKLTCDPGDVVLAPRPSYPLIEHLADLEGVAVERYSLEFQGRWSLDIHELEQKVASLSERRRVRAVIVINPNNPTGSVLAPAELAQLAALARARNLVLLADEVFADYPLNGAQNLSALSQDGALTFGLGGLSKSVGLPQLKLGWIGVSGPADLVSAAMERLETICDAYLSVSTPVQVAVAELLAAGATIREQIRERVKGNLAQLHVAASRHAACSVLPVEAGWSAVIQVPALEPEEAIVVNLLDRTGILVHPGYFFDFEREAFLVVSLLPDPAVFAMATEMLFAEIGGSR